jgi:hypothetical protein
MPEALVELAGRLGWLRLGRDAAPGDYRCAWGGPQRVDGALLSAATGLPVSDEAALLATSGPRTGLDLTLHVGEQPHGPAELGHVPLPLPDALWSPDAGGPSAAAPRAGLVEASDAAGLTIAGERLGLPVLRIDAGLARLWRLCVAVGDTVAVGQPVATLSPPVAQVWDGACLLAADQRRTRDTATSPRALDRHGIVRAGFAVRAGEVLAGLRGADGSDASWRCPPDEPCWQVLGVATGVERVEVRLIRALA